MMRRILLRWRWFVAAGMVGSLLSSGCVPNNVVLTSTANFLTYLVVGAVSTVMQS